MICNHLEHKQEKNPEILLEEFDLFILFEEVPLTSSISKILSTYYEKNVSVDKIVPFFEKEIGLCFLIEYQIDKNLYKLLGSLFSSKQSRFDVMIFESNKFPFDNSVKPNYLVEWTKSSNSDSRNMPYQRFTKFISHDFSHAKQALMIEQGSVSKEITSAYKIMARLYKTVDIPVIITNVDGSEPAEARVFNEAKPYQSIKELIKEKNNQPEPVSGQEQKFSIDKAGIIEYSIRLQKGSKPKAWSDPSIGTALINAVALRKLGYEKQFRIVQHNFKNKDLKNICSGTSKQHKAFEKYDITLDDNPIKYTGSEDYNWKIDRETEKVGTIYLHCKLNLNPRFEIIFHNHAGGEYSDITIKGERKIFEQMESKPDLCFVDNKTKKIFVIEGKKTENLEEGRKQILTTEKFSNLIKDFYKDYELKNLIVLTDSENDNTHKCPQDVLLIFRNKQKPLINKSYKYLFE